MDLVNGTYKLVSHTGMLAYMKTAGMTDDACKLVLDPSNEAIATVSFDNGVFVFKEENSKAPMFNVTTTSKLGEESEFNFQGIKTVYTLSKKGDGCFVVKSESKEQGSATTEYSFNNFGMICKGQLHDKGICFSAVYERCKPCVDGYYIFEKEEGMDAFMNKLYPDMDLALAKKATKNMSMKIETCGEMMTVEENFGDAMPPKKFTCKMDEEFRFQMEALGFDANMVMTCTGPGLYTCVSKDNKTGSVQENTYNFSKRGVSFCSKDVSSGLKATQCFKRAPDMLGSFKLITHTSMTQYFNALEIPAATQSALLPPAGMRMTTTRVGDDMFSVTSTSDLWPDVTFRLGEEYSYTVPVPGAAPITAKCMTTMTETGDIQVSKIGDKVIVMKSDITGDFIISCIQVEGCPDSKVKMIFLRC